MGRSRRYDAVASIGPRVGTYLPRQENKSGIIGAAIQYDKRPTASSDGQRYLGHIKTANPTSQAFSVGSAKLPKICHFWESLPVQALLVRFVLKPKSLHLLVQRGPVNTQLFSRQIAIPTIRLQRIQNDLFFR